MRRERWLVGTTEYAGLTSYTGGIGRHYAALVPALARQGVVVDLVVFSGAEPVEGAALPGVHKLFFERTDGMSRLAALRHRARRLRDIARGGNYARIFVPEWSALGAALPRRAPLLTNLATGMRLANEISGLRLRDLPASSWAPVVAQMLLEARQIRRSAGLIAISTAMRDRTAAAFRRLPPTCVVRNCIDVLAIRAAAHAGVLPPGWPAGDGPMLLFLGRSERRKGVVDSFAAFGLLSERMPGVRIVLAGAGGDARFEPTRAALLDALPPPARAQVTWLGHVPGDELYAAIRAADVALCPSRWEGFGNVGLEVKALGTPLVVTTGSGFDDFCEDGIDALMVPPADPQALAAALQRLLDDPALGVQLTARASERVEAFAPDPVAVDLLAAADELMGPTRASDHGP